MMILSITALLLVSSSLVAGEDKIGELKELNGALALGTCKSGSYVCQAQKGQWGSKCVELSALCNGVADCANGDDEENALCKTSKTLKDQVSHLSEENTHLQQELEKAGGTSNDFSGTGFMFSVNNLVIDGGSNVKMFNQNSDNSGQNQNPDQSAVAQ